MIYILSAYIMDMPLSEYLALHANRALLTHFMGVTLCVQLSLWIGNFILQHLHLRVESESVHFEFVLKSM
jgi:hypothetical protein